MRARLDALMRQAYPVVSARPINSNCNSRVELDPENCEKVRQRLALHQAERKLDSWGEKVQRNKREQKVIERQATAREQVDEKFRRLRAHEESLLRYCLKVRRGRAKHREQFVCRESWQTVKMWQDAVEQRKLVRMNETAVWYVPVTLAYINVRWEA